MFPLNDPVLYQVLPPTRKVVINKCYGGFSISRAALEWMAARGSAEATADLAELDAYAKRWPDNTLGADSSGRQVKRDNPLLVAAVEALGVKAEGMLSDLKVVEIPCDVEWTIEEYDGMEWVAEVHRTWS